MNTVSIRAEYEAAAVAKLEKLQRRAAKYGQVISWSIAHRDEERTRPVYGDPHRREKYVQPMADFAIDGEAPRVGPYKFLAELERVDGGVLIAALGGVEIGEAGRTWAGACEHCNKPRGRSRAYVVEHAETGERKIVGKSCLRDYVGTDVPAGALWLFQFDRSPLGSDGDEWGGGYSPWYESTHYVIAAARAAIALYGWRPASADGLSTRDYVSLLYSVGQTRVANKAEIDAMLAEIALRSDEYERVADAIITWGRDLQPRGDYEHNLKIALNSDYVGGKTFGLVVSACAAYDKQKAVVEQRAERVAAERKAQAASFHYGDAGQRYKGVQVVVDKALGLPDNGFGPSVMFLLRTVDGAVLKWITGSNPRLNGKSIDRGDKFAADFSVKRHAEYNGTPQTIVTRLKAIAA